MTMFAFGSWETYFVPVAYYRSISALVAVLVTKSYKVDKYGWNIPFFSIFLNFGACGYCNESLKQNDIEIIFVILYICRKVSLF